MSDERSNIRMAMQLGYVVSRRDRLVPYDHHESPLPIAVIADLHARGFQPGRISPPELSK